MSTLNLGIVAHVDAGKTSLTERVLHAAGVIDEIGSVDDGSTQTDTMALERQRGITIRAAVVSFAIDGVTVNMIDTPGHPDFIAEVERVLSVLDGAVLVISAVEGVQAQTRILMWALQRLRIPTLIFVNKLDRVGAGEDRVLGSIQERLSPAIVAMGVASRPGTRDAGFAPFTAADTGFADRLTELLAEHDDALLAAYVQEGGRLPYSRLRRELAVQTGRALVHPVFFGSALTGAGVDPLMAGIRELLPPAGGDPAGPVSGTVFKVERGRAGEKVAYVRMFSGTVRLRDRPPLPRTGAAKVTAIQVFERGAAAPGTAVTAGQIGKLWGLGDIRIGDPVGEPSTTGARHHFPPPTLETVVVPRRAGDRGALHTALTQLEEQDPLINVRQDDVQQEIYVSLYGEVQKEVIQATLATDHRLEVSFRESTALCIERPVRTGEAVELLQEASNPFRATIGLRIDPAPPGSGLGFRLRVNPRTIPMFIYKSMDGFKEMMGQYVRGTLREGLSGWQVTDCTVTMTRCAYSVADGPPSTRGPDSTAADFRKLTPLVLLAALQRAGTTVCEPVHRYQLEIPADTLGAVLTVLARLAATPQATVARGRAYLLAGDVPAMRVRDLQQQLPPLTRGEAVLESSFDRYQPVSGTTPTRHVRPRARTRSPSP